MNIELDIKNIDFQDGAVKTRMFSGEPNDNKNIVISFQFPENKIKTIESDSFSFLEIQKKLDCLIL
ncbi:hypothetical protein [Brachyspira pulli]|uniref:hypothetical protein n=1 Tax=Brachyspira pulli TaxID=310721 RepID=UPI003005F1BC